MFSFHEIEVVHWDYWRRFKIPLGADIVTVVGPNGSGKTTLLDALRTLLSIPCSSGRDYRRYVRHADQPYTWLRAVVSNERRGRGSTAFFPITSDRVTLLCRIRKKGGEWERTYGIAAATLSIEDAEKTDAVVWKSVRQYESELEAAGLTRAIKRVLALDQGQTDKLCEYTGRQLLELVFNVFGDQEVLDNYRVARDEQAAVERELSELATQLARLGIQLKEAEAEVNSYKQFQALIAEIGDLYGLWLPRIQLAELFDSAAGGRKQLVGARRELEALEQRVRELAQQIERKSVEEREAAVAVSVRLAEREVAEARFLETRSAHAPIAALLKEQERLERIAREQATTFDPVAARCRARSAHATAVSARAGGRNSGS
jgi:chromosome segregation ATPase